MKNNTASILKSTRVDTIPFKQTHRCACPINYPSAYSGKHINSPLLAIRTRCKCLMEVLYSRQSIRQIHCFSFMMNRINQASAVNFPVRGVNRWHILYSDIPTNITGISSFLIERNNPNIWTFCKHEYPLLWHFAFWFLILYIKLLKMKDWCGCAFMSLTRNKNK